MGNNGSITTIVSIFREEVGADVVRVRGYGQISTDLYILLFDKKALQTT